MCYPVRRLAGAAVLALAGCAVQQDGRNIRIGLDEAELFGQVVGRFQLADGSEGQLRLHAGQYSLKLQRQLRVLPIADATYARVNSFHAIDGRTVLVLEKSERNCPYKTELLSLQGAEVLSWEAGDCRTPVRVTADGDSVHLDFVQPQAGVRYTYRDARLLRAAIPAEAPSTATGGTSGPRWVPPPPARADTAGDTTRPSPSAPRPVSEARRRPAAPAPAPVPTDFPQEQKPVRVRLD